MERVTTPKFRVSFPNVFKPMSFEDQEPKYRLVMLFDKQADLTELKKLAAKAIENKWPSKDKRPIKLRSPFRDGDTEKPDIDGYPGHIFISASSKLKPGIVDRNLNPILSEDDFYAGCYARATLTAYAYDAKGNRGVAFGLQNIQKLEDGEPFSGRSKAEEDFEAIDSFGPQGSNAKAEVSQGNFDEMFG